MACENVEITIPMIIPSLKCAFILYLTIDIIGFKSQCPFATFSTRRWPYIIIVRNEVSHTILGLVCQKLQIQNGAADFVFTST